MARDLAAEGMDRKDEAAFKGKVKRSVSSNAVKPDSKRNSNDPIMNAANKALISFMNNFDDLKKKSRKSTPSVSPDENGMKKADEPDLSRMCLRKRVWRMKSQKSRKLKSL